MKKAVLKIVTVIIVSLSVMGLAVYEACSITVKEYNRQMDIAAKAESEIGLELNMIKVAVQTEDAELYARNLETVKAASTKIRELPMTLSEYAGYLERLEDYLDVLDQHVDVVSEAHKLKGEVEKIASAMQEKYTGEISRDKLKAAKDEITALRIDASKYAADKILAVVNAVNEVLDKAANKAGELSDCVDSCYKDKITSLDDDLASIFKELSDKAAGLNKEIEAQFELDRIGEVLR